MNLKRSFTKLSLMVSLILLGLNAQAVPLVRQTVADFDKAMATIYPDSDNPNLFYFLPNTGGLAKNENGTPKISLVYMGLDNPDPNIGKGYMTGVFEAGLTPALSGELRSFKSRHPQAQLTVVPFGESYLTFGKPVSLEPPTSEEVQRYVPTPAAPGQDMATVVSNQTPPTDISSMNQNGAVASNGFSDFFKSLSLPPHAGVAETQEGFSAFLTKDGAEIFKNALTGLDPLNMYLCYEIRGALPTMSAQITMNYQRIYSYFQASASGGWLYWGWSLSAVVEKLIESQDIRIVITGADDKMEDYVLVVAKDLAATYLVPTLIAAPGPSHTSPGFAFNQFGVNSTYKEERKTATWSLTAQNYITDNRCTTLSMQDLTPFANRILINADKKPRSVK